VVSTVHVACEKWRVIHCSFFFFLILKFQKNLSKFFYDFLLYFSIYFA
jgi:hypothetical protein